MTLRERLVLIAILFAALFLRVWGAFFDLPYIYHPDEPQIIVAIQQMLSTHDPRPHLFFYPSLIFYVNALAALLIKAFPAWLAGIDPQFIEPISIAMGATFAPDANAVALYRGLSIAFGVASVFIVYMIGKRECGTPAGLIAGLLAAVSPVLVTHSRYVTPDGYVVLFELLTILGSCSVLRTGRRASYLLAGVAIGAAAASKYNGAIVCICLISAHVLRCGWHPRTWAPLWLAAAASIAAFVLFNPFIVLDPQSWFGLIYQFRTYSSPHAGMDGNTPAWYLYRLWLTTGIASIFALAQIVIGWRQRSGLTIILAVFVVAYFLFICAFTLRNERTLLPIVPCIILLAAILAANLAAASDPVLRISPALRRVALAAIGIALFVAPLLRTMQEAVATTTIDSRATAREWINSQLPEGSLIAVESYAPFVSPLRFKITQAERAIDRKPEWYVDNGVDYLVLSQGTYGRYYENPKRYAREVMRYVQLAKSMYLVKRFNDGGYEILIYRTLKAPSANQP